MLQHGDGLVEELRTKNAQLELALRSRVLIEQAKGVLAERYGLTMDEAFESLRRAARSNRMRIHELAGAVVTSPRTPAAIERERRRAEISHRPFARPNA